MPNYEYKCDKCGDKHNQWHSFSDQPGPCPCGALPESLTKVIGAPAIRMGGRSSMSTRHTTEETFGPNAAGGSTKIGHVEYFPEERKAKAEELRKKQEGKGATVGGIALPKSSKKK
jgi:putative FmdB family regulatory protein